MRETPSTLEPEWALLRAACATDVSARNLESRREPLSFAIQWNLLFSLAERHGLTPLLYRLLSNSEPLIPPAEMLSLRQSYENNLHKALFLSRELIRVLDCLDSVGVEVLPYKGLALAETVYGDIALRQSGDIDLLILPQDFMRVRDAVKALGYEPHLHLSALRENDYLKSGYECAFDSALGRNLLEVQWAVQPRFYAVDLDMNALFLRAEEVTVAGRTMKTPSAEDQFTILSLHAAKHAWGRLIWLCDLSRIMRLPTLDWNRIGGEAKSLGIVRILRVTLLLINRLLEVPVPPHAESCLPHDSLSLVLAEDVQAQIARETACDPESVEYFKLMLRLRERQTDRARFLWRLVLTPGPGEWATINLPQPLSPLYRIVRLSRLAARLGGA